MMDAAPVTRREFRRVVTAFTVAFFIATLIDGGEILALQHNSATSKQLQAVECAIAISNYHSAMDRRRVEASSHLPASEGHLKTDRLRVIDATLVRLRAINATVNCPDFPT